MRRSSKKVVVQALAANGAPTHEDAVIIRELEQGISNSHMLGALPEETTATLEASTYTSEENAALLDGFKKLIQPKVSWKVARVSCSM